MLLAVFYRKDKDVEKLFCCTACGVQGESKCGCGKPYKYMSAGEVAALAVKKNPEMSDRDLAEKSGVGYKTIARAREPSAPNGAVEKRVGRDGKARRQPQKKASPKQDQVQERVNTLVKQGKPVSRKKLAEEFDVGQHTVQLAHTRATAQFEAEVEIVPERDLSKSAQEKLASAMRQYQKTLDATFEQRVQSEIKKRVEELCMPSLRERQKDAERITKARKHGIFKQAEYNAILRCVHPDLSPTTEEKNEAFRLLHENRIVLLSNADDPRKYPELPTVAEFMRG